MKEITLLTAVNKMYDLAKIIDAHSLEHRSSRFILPAPQAYHDLKAEIVALLESIDLMSIDSNIWAFLRQNHLPALASLYKVAGNSNRNFTFFICDYDAAFAMDIPHTEVHADFNAEKYEAFKEQGLLKW